MLLSIITINYNNAAGLERTARSITEQTCQDYEWIVIDGGSTDGSVDVIKKYADKMAYWVSEPDRGIYHAMNKGVDRATGDYLHMLNSGDYYYSPDVIAIFYAQDFQADVVHTTVQVVDDNGNPIRKKCHYENITGEFFLMNNFCQQALFYSKRCFVNHRFDESFRISADQKFDTELVFRNCKFKRWDKLTVCYDYSGVSSTDLERLRNENLRAQAEAFPPEFLINYCHRLLKEKAELQEVYRSYDNDIYNKTTSIVRGSKIWRHALRCVLYPLSYLATLGK